MPGVGAIKMKCPNCGSLNSESEKFCEICGASLETAAPAPEPVRKPMAIPPPKAKKAEETPRAKPHVSLPPKKLSKRVIAIAGSAAAALIALFAILNLASGLGAGGSAAKSAGMAIDLKKGEYKGEKSSNKPNGTGVYTFEEESPYDFYSGEFKNGEMDGLG
jgi:hypothetical protein